MKLQFCRRLLLALSWFSSFLWPTSALRVSQTPTTPTTATTPTPAAGPGTTTLPAWYYNDGVCADNPHGWRDTMGNSCQDYQERFYCTGTGDFGAGWWPVWGPFASYASQNHTAVTACCACGGGTQSCCPTHRAWEAEINNELAPLTGYTEYLKNLAVQNVSRAGAAEAEHFRSLMRNRVGNASVSIRSTSSRLLATEITRAESFFNNRTQHREHLPEAVHSALVERSFDTARGEVAHGQARLNSERISRAASEMFVAVRAAAERWRAAATLGQNTAQMGNDAVGQHLPGVRSQKATVGGAVRGANAFLQASAEAQQEARFSQQAMTVAADISQLAEAQSQTLDTQVRQAMERTQTALQATGGNSAKLDVLEAMVNSSEKTASENSLTGR